MATETANGAIAVLGGDARWPVARLLRKAGLTVLDAEPAPKQIEEELADRYGFGVASVRAGALGDLRLVAQMLRAAISGEVPDGIVWTEGGAPRDALRAGVEPGAESAEEVMANHAAHLAAVRRLIGAAGLVVIPLRRVEVVECGGLLFPAPPDGLKPPKSRKPKAAVAGEEAMVAAMESVLGLLGAGVRVRLVCPVGQEDEALRALAGRMVARFDRVLHHALVDEVLDRLAGTEPAPGVGALMARLIGVGDVVAALAGADAGEAVVAPIAKGEDKAARRARRGRRAVPIRRASCARMNCWRPFHDAPCGFGEFASGGVQAGLGCAGGGGRSAVA